jgi:hypothetical protein
MKKTETNSKREYLPTLVDLIDALTINQIKELKFHDKKVAYAGEIKKICHDIDLLISQKQMKLSAKLIRLIIIIAQINLFIWNNKDKMQEDPKHYNNLLKLSHQLNGIRNRMKNYLFELNNEEEPSRKRTNLETDGLKGWEISIDDL